MEDKRDNLPQADGNPMEEKAQNASQSTEKQGEEEVDKPSNSPQEIPETNSQDKPERAEKETNPEPPSGEELAKKEDQEASALASGAADDTPKEATDTPVPGEEKNKETREKPKVEATDKESSEDENWDDDEGDDAVYSDDEHHDEYSEDEKDEMPDYSQFPPAALVKEAERLLQNEPVQTIKEHFEVIRKYLWQHLDEERQEKLEAFMADGNPEIDFQYEQPLRKRFKEIFNLYRDQRKKYYRELREQLEANLQKKRELIEQLKELVTKSETIGETFKEFNAIQAAWRETGPVPRSESSTLYRNYHHHVENFYEYIKINKDLRAMDFRKNKEAKEELIRQAEALQQMDFKPEHFKKLQSLHSKWKNLGPVEKEYREPMWQQFSAATKKIREQREAYYQELQERKEQVIEEKKQLVEKIKAVPRNHTKHAQWQKAMKEVNDLAEAYKKLGRLRHPENDAVWEALKEALREFNHVKNEFYKNLKKEHQKNLEAKKALLAKAEELKDSEDWDVATETFKKLQADWKKIGHVPKHESEKVWKAFHSACNHYFERLTAKNKERESALDKNVEAKKALLDELQNVDTTENPKEALTKVKELIGNWKKAGPLPGAKKGLDKKFSKLLDEKFKALDMDRKESRRLQFETKMADMTEHGGEEKLKKEKDFLQRKLEEARQELNQLETNISFFSASKSNNPLLAEAQKNIDKKKQEMDDLLDRIKMLATKRRELKAELKTEEKEENDITEASKDN